MKLASLILAVLIFGLGFTLVAQAQTLDADQTITSPYSGWVNAVSQFAPLQASSTPFFSNFYASLANITQLCLSGDCKTAWPSGGGSGTVGTSTDLTAGQVAVATGVDTIGSYASFLFDSVLEKLTVTNASTTNLSIGSLTGFLKATSGTVSAVSSIVPADFSLTKGNFLVGNDAGVAQATSTIFISSTGNVGIGTTSPYAKLSVKGAGTTSGVNFQTTDSSDSPLFTILDSGNMGIGTTSPIYRLSIEGTGSSAQLSTATTDNTTGSFAAFNTFADSTRLLQVSHASARVVSRYGLTLGGWGEFSALNNTGTSNGLVIGVVAASPLVFGTNNLERMRIDGSTGNVGIGTTTPQGVLSTVGTGGVVITNFLNGVGTPGTLEINKGTLSPSALSSRLAYGTDGTGWKFSIAKNQAGIVTDQFVIQDNGNVGIGTTTPTGKLDVLGAYAAASLNANSVATANFRTPGHVQLAINTQVTYPYTTSLQAKHSLLDGFAYPIALNPLGGNVGIGTTTPIVRLSIANNSADGLTITNTSQSANNKIFAIQNNGSTLRIAPLNDAGSATADGLQIDRSGNVGIGTASPTNKLHVYSTTGQTSHFGGQGLGVTSTNFTGISFGYGETGPTYQKSALVQEQVGDGAARGTIHILNDGTNDSSNATLADARLSITYAGNVGIGTTTPGSILSIQGVANWVASGISTIYNSLRVTADLYIASLATPAGAFLAVDPNGQVIATTTPSGGSTVTASYATTTPYLIQVSVVAGDTVQAWASSQKSGTCSGATYTTSTLNVKQSTYAATSTLKTAGSGGAASSAVPCAVTVFGQQTATTTETWYVEATGDSPTLMVNKIH